MSYSAKIALTIFVLGISIFGGREIYRHLFPTHYSDKQMTENFLKNEDEFNKLVQMFIKDTGISNLVNEEKGSYKTFISDERLSEYNRLKRKLSIGSSISRAYGDDRIVTLNATYESEDLDGMEYLTRKKGYVYSEKPISELLENLDSGETGYKKIKDNWYLYFETGVGKPE